MSTRAENRTGSSARQTPQDGSGRRSSAPSGISCPECVDPDGARYADFQNISPRHTWTAGCGRYVWLKERCENALRMPGRVDELRRGEASAALVASVRANTLRPASP